MLSIGSVIKNQYKILRVIGNGGMSVVYQAQDLKNGAIYAIKNVERRGIDSEDKTVVQSLAVEGKMLKQLSNPHLPRIYDIIEESSSFMLVMDYVEGSSLDVVISRNGPQPAELIYDWCIQICEVFDYLHNQTPPIIYRDMKPANVILQPNGNIMLIDFGTARTEKVGADMSSDTICIGTAGFAAPEQFGGYGQSDARTDIYCLGATMYNLITGHSPCDPPTGIRPLETFNASLVGTPLDYIIHKCTHPQPPLRYQSAAELRLALLAGKNGTFSIQDEFSSGGSTWMEQAFKGVNGNTSGLSGLLKFRKGKSSILFSQDSGVLQKSTNQKSIEYADNTSFDHFWVITVISVITAIVGIIVSIMFLVLGAGTPTLIALGITICAVIVTIVGVVVSSRRIQK